MKIHHGFRLFLETDRGSNRFSHFRFSSSPNDICELRIIPYELLNTQLESNRSPKGCYFNQLYKCKGREIVVLVVGLKKRIFEGLMVPFSSIVLRCEKTVNILLVRLS